MFEFKADAQEFYNKVAKPAVESDSALPHGRAVYSARKSYRGVGIKGVSKYHNGKYVYYRAYIWVTRHTVNKQLIKTFKTLEEAVAQRQEWEQVKDILDGKVAMVLPLNGIWCMLLSTGKFITEWLRSRMRIMERES